MPFREPSFSFICNSAITHLGTGLLNHASKASGHFPTPACEKQSAVFVRAFDILRKAISLHAFPAVAIAVTRNGQLVASSAMGRLTFDPGSEVSIDTIFDLASVSKVVATTSMAMILYERGELDMDMPVRTVVPEFAGEDPRRDEVTFRNLLAHSSGLPAYAKLFETASTREGLLDAIYGMPLVGEPGTVAAYSDIGFILLGEALSRIANEPIERFCQRNIFGRLGMVRTTFNPPKAWHSAIPPTADDTWFRHRVIQGEVHDENASVLGGVAGHAGVFSSATDVAIFAHALLRGVLVRPETLSLFTRRQTNPEGTSRALGWDTPSRPSQSGKHFSGASFGHLGYTGTSLWIDPEKQLSITLLTNRTWPDNQNQAIQQVRPEFHDAIVEALQGNS